MKHKQHNNYIRTILDISILTAGRSDLFGNCIDSVLDEMKPEYKIQVFNNGHPSSEYEEIYKKLPQGSSIKRTNQDGGFPIGANSAIRSGNAPLVLFVTDDIFLHSGTVEKLIRTMDDPTIGLCGLKLLFPEDSVDPSRPAGRVQHVGMAANIRGDMFHPLIGWTPEHPKCNISREVTAITGACFIIRRGLFNKVGGFDTVFGRGYYEDMDLAMKIRFLGNKVFVNTDAVAIHGVGQTYKDQQTPPPIQQNQMIFKSRWLSQLVWDEWKFF